MARCSSSAEPGPPSKSICAGLAACLCSHFHCQSDFVRRTTSGRTLRVRRSPADRSLLCQSRHSSESQLRAIRGSAWPCLTHAHARAPPCVVSRRSPPHAPARAPPPLPNNCSAVASSTEKEDTVLLQQKPDGPDLTNIESAIAHAWPTPPATGLATHRRGACSALTSLREVLARPLRLVDRFPKHGKIRNEEPLDYRASM